MLEREQRFLVISRKRKGLGELDDDVAGLVEIVSAIQELAEEFGLPVGLSDHSIGIYTCLGGVALGACALEKHLETFARLRCHGPRYAVQGEGDFHYLTFPAASSCSMSAASTPAM